MKDRVFVDTNILIYLYSVDEPEKRKMAEKMIADKDCVISVQVLNEFSSVCLRKLRIPAQQILAAIYEITSRMSVFLMDTDTVRQALRLCAHWNYSYYDSAILAAAIQSGCATLYSEDMSDGQIIENCLTIRNVLNHEQDRP